MRMRHAQPHAPRYRDANGNFFVPLPTRGEEVDKTGMVEE